VILTSLTSSLSMKTGAGVKKQTRSSFLAVGRRVARRCR
jgi:hypothetical protein